MAKNISEEIDFYQYVDGVKQRKLSWKLFIALMQDLSYKDINRLRKLNAILLTELTINYSDLDKFKSACTRKVSFFFHKFFFSSVEI